MTSLFRLRDLLRAFTLALTVFFVLPVAVLPVAAQGRSAALTAEAPEFRPSAQHPTEDAWRSHNSADLQPVHAARPERLPAPALAVSISGTSLVDPCRDDFSAFISIDAPHRPLSRMRRILRMDSDDPPRA